MSARSKGERALEGQKMKLVRRARALRRKAIRSGRKRARLEVRMAGAERATARAASQHAEAEERSRHVAILHVVTERFRGIRAREALYAAIQEIIAGLVGSEEVAFFELDDAGAAVLTAASGVDPMPYARLAPGEGVIGGVVSRGEAYFLDDRAPSADGDRPSWVCVRGDRDVTACLPLTADGLVVGVLAIFRLLPQKGELGPFDRDLLVALAALAGPILQTAQRERSMERR